MAKKNTIIVVEYPDGVDEIMFNNFLEKEMAKISKKSATKMNFKVKKPPVKRETLQWDKEEYPTYTDWVRYLNTISEEEGSIYEHNDGYNACIDEILNLK